MCLLSSRPGLPIACGYLAPKPFPSCPKSISVPSYSPPALFISFMTYFLSLYFLSLQMIPQISLFTQARKLGDFPTLLPNHQLCSAINGTSCQVNLLNHTCIVPLPNSLHCPNLRVFLSLFYSESVNLSPQPSFCPFYLSLICSQSDFLKHKSAYFPLQVEKQNKTKNNSSSFYRGFPFCSFEP